MNAIYFVPSIPDNTSTSRYNHALSIANMSDISILMTSSSPPKRIYKKYDGVFVLNKVKNIKEVYNVVSTSLKIIKKVEELFNNNFVFITTFHYAQVLSGYSSSLNWIIDIYDDPMQLAIRRSVISPHQISARLLVQMMKKADGTIYTLHPANPRTNLGQQTRFSLNGSPVSTISPNKKQSYPPLKCVWVGKTRLGLGIEILLKSLTKTKKNIFVDIYGGPVESAKSLANDLDVQDNVNFHGNVPHQKVCSAIENAHVGLCVLSPYTDYLYSYPIKVCEYLSGGAIPIVSNYPGLRMLTNEAATYTEPRPSNLANSLDKIGSLSKDELSNQMSKSRERGERISWKKEKKRFSTHLSSFDFAR